MPDDSSYSIIERQAIRRAAEATLRALDLPLGVTRVAAESCLSLLQLFFRAKIPLSAECYDLTTFDIASLTFAKPNLLRLGDAEGAQRVLEISSSVVLFFPEIIGQAPVIYLETKSRPVQPQLYLHELYLDEWSRPVRFHEALLGEDRVIYEHKEVMAYKKAEMMGEARELPGLFSFLTEGIALAVHVAPRQFCYRFPEFAIAKIAHWPPDEWEETLRETMEMLVRNKSGVSEAW